MLEWMQYLLARGHQATVAYFVFNQAEWDLTREFEAFCLQAVPVMYLESQRSPCGDLPGPVANYCSDEMRRAIELLDRTSRFDVVDVQHIYMAQYAGLLSAPAILQEHNVESQLLRRWLELPDRRLPADHQLNVVGNATTDWRELAHYEDLTWPRFAVRTAVSTLDCAEIDRRCRIGRTVHVPNGVNTTKFRPIASYSSAGVLFTGNLEYEPNIDALLWLLDDIWPSVKSRLPRARLFVVGSAPPDWLLRRSVPKGVELIADAEDISFYASQCAVSAVPLRAGGGTRLKILTSMALGLATVSTHLGCEGLCFQDGEELIIADCYQEFADTLVRLLAAPGECARVGRAGRAAVEKRHDWQTIFPPVEQEFAATAGALR
jgi:glycosyltransferase involved in cell wall biosynthesis